MSKSGWQDLVDQCAQSIVDNRKIIQEMKDWGMPRDIIKSTEKTLEAQENLLQILVAAYLEDVCAG